MNAMRRQNAEAEQVSKKQEAGGEMLVVSYRVWYFKEKIFVQ